MNASRPTAYLKRGCPFSMRLRLFLGEAGLTDEVDMVVVEFGDERHRAVKAGVEAAGLTSSFPAVEHASGKFEVDSQAIIDRMAGEHDVDVGSLPLLRFYDEGMMPRFGKMYMELKRLKGADWNGEL